MSTETLLHRPMFIEEFAPLLGQTLYADCEPRPAPLKLVEVRALPAHAVIERLPFILIFHTTPEIFLVSGSYALRCGEFGPALVHISPTLAPLHDKLPGQYYQAVFN
jgi:hypothetical protein